MTPAKRRSTVRFGFAGADNDTASTGLGVTKRAQSVHVNLMYSPTPALSFCGEYIFANREIESGAGDDLNRIQFGATLSL